MVVLLLEEDNTGNCGVLIIRPDVTGASQGNGILRKMHLPGARERQYSVAHTYGTWLECHTRNNH